MRKYIFITNPISGTGNKEAIQHIIDEEIALAAAECMFFPSVASGDYRFLRHTIKEQEITDVVISGGDGTINRVVWQLRDLNLQFGIIPTGSGNGLALSAGIPRDVKKALKVVFKGHSKWTDAFMVNNHFACMLCGLGLDAQVAHDFANAPKRGLLTYVQKTIADFVKAPAYPFTFITQGREFKAEAFFISIANSNQFGNHFTIAPKASLTDGLLDIVVMTKQSKLSVLFNTLKQISGYNQIKSVEMINEHSSLIYFQTEEIVVINEGNAPMHIDGDPAEVEKQIKVNVLKKAFRLMYP